MNWSDIAFTPSARTVRQFAGLWILFFAALAGLGLLRHQPGRAWTCAGLAIAIGPLGLVWPRLIRPIYVGWMVLAFPIGWTIARALLACLFYGVFTPIGLVFRLTGRDALGRRYRPGLGTYWMRKPAAADVRSYFRRF